MKIKKKGAGIAFTATLLASLLLTVAAPLALATVTVAGVGTIAAGQTSATPASYTLRETVPPSPACFGPGGAGDELSVTILDAAGNNTLTFGTPSIVGPGSLGATVTGAGTNTLSINWGAGAGDPVNQEQVVVSAPITAGAAAATGPIRTFVGGTYVACVLGPTGTATGTLVSPITNAAGTASNVVLTGTCAFAVTGHHASDSNATFSDVADSRPITAVGAVADDGDGITPDPGDVQAAVTFGAGTVGHPAGATVTQTVDISHCSNEVASSGAVARALTQSAAGPTQVLPGQNNQPAGFITLSETAPASNGAQFAVGQVVTFTITTPAAGVLFSNSPGVTTTGGLTTSAGLCQISADRRSCTVTITGVSGAFESITIGTVLNPIRLDVDATVPLGTPVTVVASIAPAVPINNTGGVIAFVGRVIIGAASTPNILIGSNNQVTGAITFRESGPGFFQSGVGFNNTFGICLQTGETFTVAPVATVTNGGGTGAGGGAPGNLLLLNPATATGVASIAGTLYNGNACSYWTVFSASTAGPATITITDGTTNTPNGPHVNVPVTLTPGTTQVAILVGTFPAVVGFGGCNSVLTCAANPAYGGATAIALRVFNGGIVVTALSQPRIAAGSSNAPAGDIQLVENLGSPALAGRFRLGQTITFTILARATPLRQEVLLNTNAADPSCTPSGSCAPVVETNSSESGLLASPAVVTCPAIIPFIGLCTVTTVITQQSFGGPGTQPGRLTLRNIHYNVLADAASGPIQVQVTGNATGGATPFQQIVSNAVIGAEPARTSISNGSLPGVVRTGTFTASTKVVRRGNYITWQADMDPAKAGERVVVEICRYVGSSCGPFTRFSTRAVNSQGIALFHYNNGGAAGRISVRFRFLGNADHGPGVSLARPGLYT